MCQRALHLSLSGAGFLGIFHLGVGKALQRAGLLDAPCQIAGASAGALVGAVLTTETDLANARAALAALIEHTRAAPLGMLTPGYSLIDQVRQQLELHMPGDAHQRASGRLHVALTSLRPGEVGSIYHKSLFASRDELIDAVSASSDIPGLTGRVRAAWPSRAATPDDASLLQRLTRRQDVDGGLFDLFPDPWEGAKRVAFVSPFAGTGFAMAPQRESGSVMVPAWSPLQGAKNGRTIELSRGNARRWRHAFFPPPAAMLAHYEAQGHDACVEWMSSEDEGEGASRGRAPAGPRPRQ